MQARGEKRLTRVFHAIGSTKLLNISPSVSAHTRTRLTTFGSLFMHRSHSWHVMAMAGTRVSGWHLFVKYREEHSAISCKSSGARLLVQNLRTEQKCGWRYDVPLEYSRTLASTSCFTVMKNEKPRNSATKRTTSLNPNVR